MSPSDPDEAYDRYCEQQAENHAAEQAYLESAGAEAEANLAAEQWGDEEPPF